MEEFGKLEERVVLVGVQTDDHDNVEESLDELKELASTAGAVTVGRIIQNRESVHPGLAISLFAVAFLNVNPLSAKYLMIRSTGME